MSDSPKPKSRWMSILLIISLALNLLIVGVALGTVLRVKGGEHGRGAPGFGSALYRALPKDERKAMRGELFDQHRKRAQSRSEDFVALSVALRADPFDPQVIEVLLDQQAESTASLQEALQQEWLARVVAMSDEERLSYADRLEDVVKRGPHGHKKKD